MDARTLIGCRCVDGVWWRISGGATLVGFGNYGCEFRDCGLRKEVSIGFKLGFVTQEKYSCPK